MKKITVDASPEKDLVTLCIMDTKFLQKIGPIVKPQYLHSPYAREVMTWVLEYHEHYDKAPEGLIQSIFEQKRSKLKDEEVVESISDFLSILSDSYDESYYKNTQYFIDSSESYIKKCNLDNLSEKLQACILNNEIAKGEQLVSTFQQAGIPQDTGISIISSHEEIRSAFDDNLLPIFRFPGALGQVAGNFYRGDVSIIMAYSKGGKSFGLLAGAEEAAKNGNNVTFISLEMRKAEAIQRAVMSLQQAPNRRREVTVPFFHAELEKGEQVTETTIYTVRHNVVECDPVKLDNLENMEAIMKMRMNGGDIRFFFLPAESTTVQDIEVILDNLSYYQGYNTDMLVIDYADLLTSKHERDYRHKIDDIYRNMRRVAQSRNIHIMTASQSSGSGEASKGGELTADNLAEDRRKGSHASQVYGLYASPKERKEGIAHFKQILMRYEPEAYEPAVLLNCYAIGRFCVDSRLESNVLLDKEKIIR